MATSQSEIQRGETDEGSEVGVLLPKTPPEAGDAALTGQARYSAAPECALSSCLGSSTGESAYFLRSVPAIDSVLRLKCQPPEVIPYAISQETRVGMRVSACLLVFSSTGKYKTPHGASR